MSIEQTTNLELLAMLGRGRVAESRRLAEGVAGIIGGLRRHQIDSVSRYLMGEMKDRDEAMLKTFLGMDIRGINAGGIQKPFVVAQDSFSPTEKSIWKGIPVIRRGDPSFLTEIGYRSDVAERYSLSLREVEVLACLISEDTTAGQIAKRLSITDSTTKTHLNNIYPKLDTADKVTTAVVSLKEGLLFWIMG